MLSTTVTTDRCSGRRWGRALAVTGVAAAALGTTVLVAPSAFGDASRTAAAAGRTGPARPATAAVEVRQEKGFALSCTGSAGVGQVVAEVYSNSTFGAQATVTLESPRGRTFVGHRDPLDPGLVDEGRVRVRLPLGRLTDDGVVATERRADLRGTYGPAGRPTRVDEAYSDAGYDYVVRGTNTPLAAEVEVRLDGRRVSLDCSGSFAFDLTVTATPTT